METNRDDNEPTSSPLVTDFLLSIYAAALLHYRRESICRPRPDGHDFKFLTDELNSIPHDALRRPLASSSSSSPSLLHWLHRAPRRFQPSHIVCQGEGTCSQWLQRHVPQYYAGHGGEKAPPPDIIVALSPPSSPLAAPLFTPHKPLDSGNGKNAIYRKEEVDSMSPSLLSSPPPPSLAPSSSPPPPPPKIKIAFHGTSGESIHSILAHGLQPLSGTRLQQNGDIFGDGVYLSECPVAAYGFTKAAPTWQHSELFKRAIGIRCMLVCHVVGEAGGGEVRGKEGETSSSSSLPPSLPRTTDAPPTTAASPAAVPGTPTTPSPVARAPPPGPSSIGKYLIVPNPSSIVIKYALIYVERESKPRASLSFIYMMYGCLLLALWLGRNPSFQLWWRHVKRQYGVGK